MTITFTPLHTGSSAGVMLPLAGAGGDTPYAQSSGAMPPLTGISSARARGSSAGAMLPLIGLSSDLGGYAESRGVMLPLEGEAYSGLPDPGYTLADTMMWPLIGAGHMFSGTIGQAEGTMLPLIGLSADYPYAQSSGVMLPLTGFSCELTHGNFIFDRRRTRLLATKTRTERAGLRYTSAPTRIIVQEHTETLSLSDVRTTKLIAVARNRHLLVILSKDVGTRVVHVTIAGVAHTLPAVPDLTWCFNADTYAASRLEYHDFNSLVAHQGHYYAASDDGIFEAGGEDYDGVPIDAFVAFGRQLLGSEELKRLIRAYLAGDSEGLMALAVQDDKGSPIYRYNAEAPLASQAETRVITGKGLQSTYYRLALSNKLGKDFRLDFVRMLVEALRKRIK